MKCGSLVMVEKNLVNFDIRITFKNVRRSERNKLLFKNIRER